MISLLKPLGKLKMTQFLDDYHPTFYKYDDFQRLTLGPKIDGRVGAGRHSLLMEAWCRSRKEAVPKPQTA